MTLNSLLRTYQILTNDDQMIIFCLSYFITTVLHCGWRRWILIKKKSTSLVLKTVWEIRGVFFCFSIIDCTCCTFSDSNLGICTLHLNQGYINSIPLSNGDPQVRVFIFITWYKAEPAWTHTLEGPHIR